MEYAILEAWSGTVHRTQTGIEATTGATPEQCGLQEGENNLGLSVTAHPSPDPPIYDRGESVEYWPVERPGVAVIGDYRVLGPPQQILDVFASVAEAEEYVQECVED